MADRRADRKVAAHDGKKAGLRPSRGLLGVLIGCLVLAAVPAAHSHGDEQHLPRPGKVMVVSFPSVGWEDSAAGLTPNLSALAHRWAPAAMSVRTVGSTTDQASALVSIGAGNRARANGGFAQATGDMPVSPNALALPGDGVRVRAMRHLIADNRRLDFGAEPGALGDVLHQRGLKTAVVGNSDGGVLYRTSRSRRGTGRDRRRFGALALADKTGRVDLGHIGDRLTVRDPATLNGYRADPRAVVEAARTALAASDVMLVELADAYREGLVVHTALPEDPDPSEADLAARDRAVQRDDRLLGRLLDLLDLRTDTIIVVSTAAAGPSEPERLTAAVLAGMGSRHRAFLTSAVTLRDGLVTITDVAPTILRLMGGHQPAAMSGRPMHPVPAGGINKVSRLVAFSDNALFHGRWVGAFFSFLVATQALLYLAAWRRISAGWGLSEEWLRRLCLFFMALPIAVLPLVALRPHRAGPWLPPLVVLAAGLILVAASLRGPWSRRPSGPPAFIAGVTFLVISLDVLAGSRLQLSSLIGYSPIVAGRFYGLGNLSFALLATTAMMVAARIGASDGSKHLWGAAAVGVFAVVVDGFDRFGADFGGVVALVPAIGYMLIALSGKRFTPLKAAALGAAALALALAAGWLDSLRPVDEQTHLGRFVERLVDLGPGSVAQLIARKLQANWWLLTKSVLTLSIPIAVILLALLLRRPDGRLHVALQSEAGLRIGLVAAGIVNTLGFAVNDSGVAIPAMGLAMAVSYCLATILGMPESARTSPSAR